MRTMSVQRYALVRKSCVRSLLILLAVVLIEPTATSAFWIRATESHHHQYPWVALSVQHSDVATSKINDEANAASSFSNDLTDPPPQPPLPPHTFAGMVERGLIERFGKDPKLEELGISRILQSWRLLDRNYVHQAFVGDPNVVDPTTSQCHQLCHSYVPGLTVREFWDPDDCSWARRLQSQYTAIRDEFLRVTNQPAQHLQAVGHNVWAGALSDDASSYGPGWKTLVLMNRGVWDPVNANLFPVTAKAVHDAKVPAVEVFFASMEPHSIIQPHSDFTNFVLTSHLALDIPYSGDNKCRLSVGDTQRQWINGELMLFDTSIQHDAINESDLTRYILMLRVWHPDLSDLERQALQFTFSALEEPDLVSLDPERRRQAEQAVATSLAFPKLRTAPKLGFGSSRGSSSSAAGGGKKKRGRQ
jgi:aspartyl/asparaginyl beta-hydroxylase (cupin superfamily)